MNMQRTIGYGLFALLCAGVLSGILLSVFPRVVAAQDHTVVIEDAPSCDAAGGSWAGGDDRCTMTSLYVRAQALTVTPTVTLAVSRTFSNGGLEFAAIRPDILIVSVMTGTTAISGTLEVHTQGQNYHRLTNHGVLQLDGEFFNQFAVASACDQSLPEPVRCRITPHVADLRNTGQILVRGQLHNHADLWNDGELLVTGDVSGSVPISTTAAAQLADIAIDAATAQVMNDGMMVNTGVMENHGTIYVATATATAGWVARPPGAFQNIGHLTNYGAVGSAVGTDIDNRGTISNTGVLVFAGMTVNGGRILGDGALVNCGDFINVGRLGGMIYNEGRIFNAGIIDGSVFGPGEVIDLTHRQYLPITRAPR